MDYEDHQAIKNEEGAYYKNEGKKRCKVCKLFECICQTSLKEFEKNE